MLTGLLEKVGNTPVLELKINGLEHINLYAKLEYYNPTGSVKDRAAAYIIEKLMRNGEIDHDTSIIESSSGNMGIALSAVCKKYGLKFLCVVDPNITPVNEAIIRTLSTSMIKVTERDSSGGYLLNRIERVKELLKEIPNSYWVNQYANPYNAEAYYHTLGSEMCSEIPDIDYVFIGVSSGGTITGVSQKVKKIYPKAKVIAVDSIGSVVFGGKSKKRSIPGIGSSMVPDILKYALIDDVVLLDEAVGVKMCHELLEESLVFAGGSSGSVIGAVKQYFKSNKPVKKPNVVIIFPDRGDRYASTIYNESWYSNFFREHAEALEQFYLDITSDYKGGVKYEVS